MQETDMKNDFPVLIILYKPELELLEKNIKSALKAGAKKILLVDNSDDRPFSIERLRGLEFDNIKHVWNGKNMGIAYALNVGCSLLYNEGYSWVLTLDQDSIVPSNLLGVYSSFLSDNIDKVGILSCDFLGNKETNMSIFNYEFVNFCITSGSLLNLDAWNNVGRFDEKLFIDGVDHDLSIRLKIGGYKIVKFTNLHLIHRLGDPRIITLLHHRFNIRVGHSPMRAYYMTRNSKYIIKKYGKKYTNNSVLHLQYVKLILIVLLFEKHKINYLTSFFMGYYDYRKNQFRTYEELKKSSKLMNWLLK